MSLSNRQWDKLLIRFGWRCHYCGRPVRRGTKERTERATHDEIIPVSRGGEEKMWNTVLACDACNSMKKNRTKDEFLRDRPAFRRTVGKVRNPPTTLFTSGKGLQLPVRIAGYVALLSGQMRMQ
jgi:5-methylcytosine-specific restriction endonuclease McrA